MIRTADGGVMATLDDGVECELIGEEGCPCPPCVWTRFIIEDPHGAGAVLEAEALMAEEHAYHPPMFVRSLLHRHPWMDWLLLKPPERRLWLLRGHVWDLELYPNFAGVFPAWAWNALREEGLDERD